MIDAFIDSLQAFPRGLVFVAEGLIVLLLAKLAKDAVTATTGWTRRSPPRPTWPWPCASAATFIAIILVFLGCCTSRSPAADGPPSPMQKRRRVRVQPGVRREVLRVFLYSLAGIVALNLVRVLFDRL